MVDSASETLDWFKSSYSAMSGNCVEINTSVAGTVLMRSSRRPGGASLAFSRPAFAAFVAEIKAGNLDGVESCSR
jgi:hypothetical protein